VWMQQVMSVRGWIYRFTAYKRQWWRDRKLVGCRWRERTVVAVDVSTGWNRASSVSHQRPWQSRGCAAGQQQVRHFVDGGGAGGDGRRGAASHEQEEGCQVEQHVHENQVRHLPETVISTVRCQPQRNCRPGRPQVILVWETSVKTDGNSMRMVGLLAMCAKYCDNINTLSSSLVRHRSGL